MIEYIERFVNVRNEAFGNLPVCPFAKKAIKHFHVMPLDESILNLDHKPEVSIYIDPDKTFPVDKLENLTTWINERLVGLTAFSGHPEHTYMLNGVYTRREPYPSIQIISSDFLRKKAELLKRTKYYKFFLML